MHRRLQDGRYFIYYAQDYQHWKARSISILFWGVVGHISSEGLGFHIMVWLDGVLIFTIDFASTKK